MRRVSVTQTGSGDSAPIMMDQYLTPFNIGMGVVVSGTVTYTVQHTFDDLYNPNVSATWFNHPTLASLSVNADGNYAFPVTAIRLDVSAGAGSATLTTLQAGTFG